MSDMNELIIEARDYAGADEYPGAEFLRAVADALETERAEVERLRGENTSLVDERDTLRTVQIDRDKAYAAAKDVQLQRIRDMEAERDEALAADDTKAGYIVVLTARAERAEAELAEIRVEWGMDAWQTRTKAAEAENARLTAWLQAVREYVDEHEHPDDWNVPCVYTDGLRALLDAAADGGE